jgi:hypothetical protein
MCPVAPITTTRPTAAGYRAAVSELSLSADATVVVVFAGGTLHIVSTFTSFSASVNPNSWRVSVTFVQTTEVVGGSGQFATASGSFDSTLTGKGSLARNPDGSCSFDQQPLREEDKIAPVGTLTF